MRLCCARKLAYLQETKLIFWRGICETFQQETGSTFRNVRNKVNLLVEQRRQQLIDWSGEEEDANEFTNAVDEWIAILDDEDRERQRRKRRKEGQISSMERANEERAALTLGRYERQGLVSQSSPFVTAESQDDGPDVDAEGEDDDEAASDSEPVVPRPRSVAAREVSASISEASTEARGPSRKRRRGGEDLLEQPLALGLFRELLSAVKTPAPAGHGDELRQELRATTERVSGIEEKVESGMTELKTQLDQILAAVSSQPRPGTG